MHQGLRRLVIPTANTILTDLCSPAPHVSDRHVHGSTGRRLQMLRPDFEFFIVQKIDNIFCLSAQVPVVALRQARKSYRAPVCVCARRLSVYDDKAVPLKGPQLAGP